MRTVVLLAVVVTAAITAGGFSPARAGPPSSSIQTSGALAAARPKPKPTAPSQWVALVHLEGEVPSSWVSALTASVRTAGDRTWIDAPAISLDDAALTLGCASWGPGCAAQVAGMTGASNAVIVEARRAPGSAVVSVAVAAVAADGSPVALAGAGPNTGAGEHIDVSVDDNGLKLAQVWIAGAIKGVRPTVLVVTSDLDGTEVVVDNVPVGKTPLTLVDVAAGPHALLLRREGRAPISRAIDVKNGVINREHGVLSSGGLAMKTTPVVAAVVDGVPATPPDASPPLAVIGWSIAGVGAAAAVGGAVVGGLAMGDYYRLLDDNGNVKVRLCAIDGGFAPSGDGRCQGDDIVPRTRDNDAITDFRGDLLTQAAIGFAIGGAGLVVAGVGAGMAVVLGGEEADDAAVTPAR